MKHQLNLTKILRYTLSFLGLCAGVWLASEAMAYRQYSQLIAANEQNVALEVRLTEVAQLNALLRQINNGKLDEAKVSLNSSLVNSLAEVKSLTPEAQPSVQELAGMQMARFAKCQKAHPEYYVFQEGQSVTESSGVIRVAAQR